MPVRQYTVSNVLPSKFTCIYLVGEPVAIHQCIVVGTHHAGKFLHHQAIVPQIHQIHCGIIVQHYTGHWLTTSTIE